MVNNYLKGQQPPAFDLLYWNGDSTNLPGPMYAYYLRNTYQDNKLAKPDALTMCGVPVSLKRVDMPAFVFAAREDHIVPWKGGYESARSLGGQVKFVLGASGHIAGSINPASKNKRSYWVNERLGPDPDKWFAQAHGSARQLVGALGEVARRPTPASSWPRAGSWATRSTSRSSPRPGRYVKERAEIGK